MNLRTTQKPETRKSKFVPFKIGKSYIFRTISFANIGKVKAIKCNWIILTNASWIQDTGKWSACLRKEYSFKQVEPFKDELYINIDSIIDATPYYNPLPIFKENDI